MPKHEENLNLHRIFYDIDPIEEYGLNPRCKECLAIRKCENPQYDAPHLTLFYCKDFKGANNGKNKSLRDQLQF